MEPADGSPPYHELYEVGAGCIKIRTTEAMKEKYLSNPELEVPTSPGFSTPSARPS